MNRFAANRVAMAGHLMAWSLLWSFRFREAGVNMRTAGVNKA